MTSTMTDSHGILRDKVQRAMSVRSDSVAMKAALDTIDTADTKTVRTHMEQDALLQAQYLLQELRATVASVQKVSASVNETAALAAQLVQLQPSEEEAKLAAEIASAQQSRDKAAEEYKELQEFLKEFSLTAADSRLLEQGNLDETLEFQGFLRALATISKICNSPRSISMLDNLAAQQEHAYQRLYEWIQSQLEHPHVPQALRALKRQPAYFNHACELWATQRRAAVTKHFLLALTVGDENRAAMEIKAHDPVAYTGEMLAYSFRTLSVEGDMVLGLLQFDGDEEGEEKVDEAEFDEFTKLMTALDMLSISLSGLSRPLKSRILQVVSSLARRPDDDEDDDESDDRDDWIEEEGSIIRNRITHLYDIAGLLLFYKEAMQKSLAKMMPDQPDLSKNPLMNCLTECLSETSESYQATVRAYGAMLSQVASVTGTTESQQVKSMLSQLSQVHEQSPGFGSSEDMPALSIEWVTRTLVEAARCLGLDDVLALQESVRSAVSAGLSSALASELEESIALKSKKLMEKIVDDETRKVLDLCGLLDVVNKWKKWKEMDVSSAGAPSSIMATYPGLSQQEVELPMKEFYGSLYSPPIPALETAVKDPVARKKTRSQITSRVSSVYEQLHTDITAGGYDDLSFLIHSPQQVKTLFSV